MSELLQTPLTSIRENEVALRSVDRDSEQFQGLRDSIKAQGILNPINVRRKAGNDGKEFELIDGLQRFTASLEAGLETIPVHVIEKDDAEALLAQMIGNVHRIDTKPAEYTKALLRILSMNPTMTEAELASSLSKTPAWISQRLSLVNLDPKISGLVNEGKITLTNAYPLAKLPKDEQLNFLERAMTLQHVEFGMQVNARIKEINTAKRQGRSAETEKFVAVPHQRKKLEIEAEVKNPTVIPALIQSNNIENPIDAALMAIKWTLNMDPESVAAAEARYNEKKAHAEEQKKRRLAEREAKKASEASDAVAA